MRRDMDDDLLTNAHAVMASLFAMGLLGLAVVISAVLIVAVWP